MLLSFKKALGLVIAVAALTVVALPSARADTLFTDQATFTASLAPGYYSENFSGLLETQNYVNGVYTQGFLYPQSLTFVDPSSSGYSFVATAPNPNGSNDGYGGYTSVYRLDRALTANDGQASLTFTFTGRLPTAVGGQFYATTAVFDESGFLGWAQTPETITVLLGDNTTTTLITTAEALSGFIGFTSDSGIQSLAISLPDQSDSSEGANFNSPTTDLIIEGQAVPEPSGLVALLGLAGMGLVGLVWRRRAAA